VKGRPQATSFADAHRIGRALLGTDPAPVTAGRWLEAIDRAAAPRARGRDRKLWNHARRGTPWLELVDAGLALVDAHSPVRQRVYLMLAVLETTPEHAARFEPHASSAAVALARLAIRGTIGALRTAIGAPLVIVYGAIGR
jgi:hypothetical protein